MWRHAAWHAIITNAITKPWNQFTTIIETVFTESICTAKDIFNLHNTNTVNWDHIHIREEQAMLLFLFGFLIGGIISTYFFLFIKVLWRQIVLCSVRWPVELWFVFGPILRRRPVTIEDEATSKATMKAARGGHGTEQKFYENLWSLDFMGNATAEEEEHSSWIIFMIIIRIITRIDT